MKNNQETTAPESIKEAWEMYSADLQLPYSSNIVMLIRDAFYSGAYCDHGIMRDMAKLTKTDIVAAQTKLAAIEAELTSFIERPIGQ